MILTVDGCRVVLPSSHLGDDVSRQWFHSAERVFTWNVINLEVNNDLYTSCYKMALNGLYKITN